MSRKQKLKERLFNRPKDFTWAELVTLLGGFGYIEIQGRGSRVRFYNQETDSLIFVHKPHPGNILKQYVIDDIIEKIKELESSHE